MDALLILGNQLFEPSYFDKIKKNNTLIFIREDRELCTYFKFHKHKIIFFLSAMRSYAEELKASGYNIFYESLDDDELKYDQAFKNFLIEKKIVNLSYFEIEDKFFEKRILTVIKTLPQLNCTQLTSPMFLTSRQIFKDYISKTKKPFMKSFYESQRKRLGVLIEKDGSPTGGQWSFAEDNRQALPKNFTPKNLPAYKEDKITAQVQKLVEKTFSDHVGDGSAFWLPTDRKSAREWLDLFLKDRFENFGPYEDAMSKEHPFINHSVLTPFLNVGLLTPDEIIQKTVKFAKAHKVPMNSAEGFIRQIIGWREFIRGIYQNYSEKQDTENFFKHTRKLKPCWYDGTTGIEPLDDVITKVIKYGYSHHIERLMVVGSLMLLLEVHPQEGHRWFMEMYIDSSDWVMGPNVYGMALFSDGGIFATKPYFCGSNYYRKMGPYKSGDWQDAVDGLYWGFIDQNRKFFSKNPRMSMMVKTFDKMDEEKRKRILIAAKKLKEKVTS